MIFLILSLIVFFLAFHGATGLAKTGLVELVAAAPTVLTLVSDFRRELVLVFLIFHVFVLPVLIVGYLIWTLLPQIDLESVVKVTIRHEQAPHWSTTGSMRHSLEDTARLEDSEPDPIRLVPGAYPDDDAPDATLSSLCSWLKSLFKYAKNVLFRLMASSVCFLGFIKAIHGLWMISIDQPSTLLLFLFEMVLNRPRPLKYSFTAPPPASQPNPSAHESQNSDDDCPAAADARDQSPIAEPYLAKQSVALPLPWIEYPTDDASVIEDDSSYASIIDDTNTTLVQSVEIALESSASDTSQDIKLTAHEESSESKCVPPPVAPSLNVSDLSLDAPQLDPVSETDPPSIPNSLEVTPSPIVDGIDKLGSITAEEPSFVLSAGAPSFVPASAPATAPKSTLNASARTFVLSVPPSSFALDAAAPSFVPASSPPTAPQAMLNASTPSYILPIPAASSVLDADAPSFVPISTPAIAPQSILNAYPPTSLPPLPPVAAPIRPKKNKKKKVPFARRTELPSSYWARGGTAVPIFAPDGSTVAPLVPRVIPEKPLLTRDPPDFWAPRGSLTAIPIIEPQSA
ncbi:hypothetical protein R3P38DRAFT_2825765 [Favolaschia claudopus]|uniref:Uncharacterized protein n=1 Tax=Favolaschia claudopus TaxID=2862362 RepID=A0AAW0EK77_9AGAR